MYGANPVGMSLNVEDHLDSETLFRRHGAFVARLLHRLGLELPELEDVLQEIFLVVHRKGGYRAGPAKPTTYLAAVAVKAAATHRSKGRTRGFVRSSDALVVGAVDQAAGPEQMAVAHEQLCRVHQHSAYTPVRRELHVGRSLLVWRI